MSIKPKKSTKHPVTRDEIHQRRISIKKRNRKIFVANLLVFGIGILIGGLIARGGLGKIEEKIKTKAFEIDPALFNSQRVLVLGMDQSSGSTDVMFTIESDGSKTNVLQIPRDTLVDSAQYGVIKANALYTLGGPEKTENEIQRITGSKVDHFARINLAAIRKISEAIDGVEINVPIRMKYDDYSQNSI